MEAGSEAGAGQALPGWRECVLCSRRTEAGSAHDVHGERGRGSLGAYLSRVTRIDMELVTYSRYACGDCVLLVDDMERAERRFLRARARLFDIVARNPLLQGCGALREGDRPDELRYSEIKSEPEDCKSERCVSSEDDEPLSRLNDGRPSSFNRRHLSDDDLYVNLKDNIETGKICNRRSTRKLNKIIKNMNEDMYEKDPSDMLIVELKEPVDENQLNVILEESNENLKTKRKSHRKHGEKIKKEKKFKRQRSKDPSVCPECNKSFTKACYLQYHLAQIHKKGTHPFICEVCGRGFKTARICEVHVLMHQGISDWKCIPCNKLFPNKFAFERHDKIHNGKPKYQCDLCGKSFIHKSSFRMHNFMHQGIKKASCDICGLALLSNSHLVRHKRIHSGEKRFQCEYCNKKFSEKYNLQSHMKTHMKVNDAIPPEPTSKVSRKRFFRCEICEEKFDRLFKLELHLIHEHKQVLKKGPPKPRNTWKKLRRVQEAAATMVNVIASAMNARRDQQLATTSNEPVIDEKPSVSSLSDKVDTSSNSKPFKSSPNRSMSPVNYMSPPQPETAPISSHQYQLQYQNHLKSGGAPWPFYNLGAGYAGYLPDYSPQ